MALVSIRIRCLSTTLVATTNHPPEVGEIGGKMPNSEEFKPRKNNLTEDDIKHVTQALENIITSHICRLEVFTPSRVGMLVSMADLGIEAREDSIKLAKKALKWSLFIIGLTAIAGALAAFIGGLWFKVKFIISGHG